MLPGLIGLVMATEAIKLIVGIGNSLVGRLLCYEALEMRFDEVPLPRDPTCPLCGEHRTIHKVSHGPTAPVVCAIDGGARR